MAINQTLKLALVLPSSILAFHFISIYIHALNVEVQNPGANISQNKVKCSRKCESKFCSVPPFLRYGKYCGLLYSGCPGEEPCDTLDACCMKHDSCIESQQNDYLSLKCSKELLDCMREYKKNKGPTFEGNDCNTTKVVKVITVAIKAASTAGKVLRRP